MIENKEPYQMVSIMDLFDRNLNVSFNSHINKKFSNRHTNRTGISVTGLFYDLDNRLSPEMNDLWDNIRPDITPARQVSQGNASSSMISIFTNSVINITDRLSTNIGVTSQLLTLNNSWALEPRVSFKYNIASSHTLGIAYGLHSRREKLDYYYIKIDDKFVNKDLKFAKTNHFVFSYDWGITDNIHLRIEPYYQYLYDVPVEPGTSFSIINHAENYLNRALVNRGNGRNYGLDITLERYLNRGYYWLVTGSIFNSEYKGGDGVWRNTRYNRKFITNVIVGKEWMLGNHKQNVLSANIGLLFQGGEYDTPIDQEASREQGTLIFDETKAYSIHYPSSLSINLSIGYKINRAKVSHEFSIKVLNATAAADTYGYKYNKETDTYEKDPLRITMPNISYKLYF